MPFLHSGLMNFIHKNQQFEVEDIIYDQYTFIQLTHRLQKSFRLSLQIFNCNIIATWESLNTLIIINYDLDGKFIHKIKEEWK